MAEKLAAKALATGLAALAVWAPDAGGTAISREFGFKDFSAAFGFMTRVALLAQAADHHPDWSNSYNKVRISLSTHSAGGVTQNDLDLAAAIDKLL